MKKARFEFTALYRVVTMAEVSVSADTIEQAFEKAKAMTDRRELVDVQEGVQDVDGGMVLVSVTNLTKWDPEA